MLFSCQNILEACIWVYNRIVSCILLLTVLFCHFTDRTKKMHNFSGLTLVACQTPTNAPLSLPYATGQGRENIMKVHELR